MQDVTFGPFQLDLKSGELCRGGGTNAAAVTARPVSGQRRCTKIHANKPTLIISNEVSASARVECITSGAIAPAAIPLSVEPITA